MTPTAHRAIGASPRFLNSCQVSSASLNTVHQRRAGARTIMPTPSAAVAAHDFASVSSAQLVQQLMGLPFPPVQPLIGGEAGSFAEETITTRLPAIMDTVLADLKAEAEASSSSNAADFKEQLAAAAEGVKAIQQEMPVDGPLQPLSAPKHLPASHPLHSIIPSTNAAVAAWQQHSGKPATWLQLPWLTVECYLYVRLATIVAEQPLLLGRQYDPFYRQKCTALDKSLAAAADMAAALNSMLQQQQDEVAAAGCGVAPQLQAHFSDGAKQRMYQLLQYALWGNKTDLSMLVDVAHMDSSTVAAVGSGSANIIVDEFEALWSYLKNKAGAAAAGSSQSSNLTPGEGLPAAVPQVDIILDNAGLELFTDLVLADYLVASGFCSEVVLHGKTLPWFVSDTLAHDLDHLVSKCSSSSNEALAVCGKRWQQHLQSGRWRFVADEFWTTPHPFWWMQQLAPALHEELASSALLVFKGDLNYRKLAGDCRWPPTTPFCTALTGFCPTGLLSLRTLKADVIAGLAEGEAEKLDKVDPRWQVNGKFGVVQFAQP